MEMRELHNPEQRRGSEESAVRYADCPIKMHGSDPAMQQCVLYHSDLSRHVEICMPLPNDQQCVLPSWPLLPHLFVN